MKVRAYRKYSKLDQDFLADESLTQNSVYFVIGIEGNYYRIVNDNGEPILFPKDLFETVDPKIPSNWIKTVFEGETYVEPPETGKPGFYEDYFDGVSYAVNAFRRLLNDLGINANNGK